MYNLLLEIWQQKEKKAYKTEGQVIHHKKSLQEAYNTV